MGGSVRVYSMEAVGRKAYGSSEKRHVVAGNTVSKKKTDGPRILEFNLDESASRPQEYFTVAGGKVAAKGPNQGAVESTAGQHQGQDGTRTRPTTIASQKAEDSDHSHTLVLDHSTLTDIEEDNELGKDDSQSAKLETAALLVETEHGIQHDLQDIEGPCEEGSQSLSSSERRLTVEDAAESIDSLAAVSTTSARQDGQEDLRDLEVLEAETSQNPPDFESRPMDNPEALVSMAVSVEKMSQTYLDPKAQLGLGQEPINRTIHILGLAATGKYIAHSIASLPFAPPVTLLMHRPLMMQLWHDEGAAIHVIKDGKLKTQTNFHIESSADFGDGEAPQRYPGFGPNLEHTAEPPNYPIDALIVTTEPYKTISALDAIKHRLGKGSTVFLVNDGLGLAEKLNETIFSDPNTRPTYILGNLSHTLQSTERQYTLIERKTGRLECSKFPQVLVSRERWDAPIITRKHFSWTPHASHLVETLARTPELCTLTLGHKWFIQKRFEDLVAGAVIGPLSVVFDCTNDLLLYNYSASQIMTTLIGEISRVIRNLPELKSLHNLDKTFSVKRLNAIVISKISKTGNNTSTMLQRVRAGHRTDIDYFNGYIERRARELRIDTPRNQMMLQMVKGKGQARSRQINNYIPFKDDY